MYAKIYGCQPLFTTENLLLWKMKELCFTGRFAASCTWGPREARALLCKSIETRPKRHRNELQAQCTKLKELGQRREAGEDLSNKANSLQRLAKLMPLFTTWQKTNIVSFSTVCAWRCLIPLGHTRRRCCKVIGRLQPQMCLHEFCQRGEKSLEKHTTFFYPEVKVSLQGQLQRTLLHWTPETCQVMDWAKPHHPASGSNVTLCPDHPGALGYLFIPPLAMPSSSTLGLAILRALSNPKFANLRNESGLLRWR